MLYSLFYITQLQVENTILNTCLSAPRLRNKRSQKDFSSQSSKMTLVIRISGSCHAGGKLIKNQLVSATSPFTIPAKHRIWKDLIQRMAGNYREENRCVWGVGVGERRQLESLCSVPSLLLHSHTLNTSHQVPQPQRPETESLITGNR